MAYGKVQGRRDIYIMNSSAVHLSGVVGSVPSRLVTWVAIHCFVLSILHVEQSPRTNVRITLSVGMDGWYTIPACCIRGALDWGQVDVQTCWKIGG